FTVRLGPSTVNGCAPEVPPPGAGVTTVMLAVPAAAMSLARMAAVTCVALTKLVVRGLPLTRTTELVVKLVPVAVRGKAEGPAIGGVGVVPDRGGAGVGAVS